MESDGRLKKVCPQCDTTVQYMLDERFASTHVAHSPTHTRGSTPPRVLHFSAFHYLGW